MKKKILSLLILLIITGTSSVYCSYTEEYPISGGYNIITDIEYTDTSKIAKMVEDMSSGYYGSENNPTIATVLMQVTKTKDSNGNVIYKVGKGDNSVIWYSMPNECLFDKDGTREIDSTWGVWLDISYITDPQFSGTNENGNITNKYSASVGQTYLDSDSFDPETDGWKGQKAIDKVVKAIERKFETVLGAGQKAIDVATWTAKFLKNPLEVGVSTIIDILVGWLGDGLQWWASIPQTWREKTYSDWTITYSYDELQKDAAGESIKDTKKFSSDDAIGNRDIYTKVGSYSNDKGSAIAKINLSQEKYGDYKNETEIPVMVGDVYNIVVNRLDFLDTNFLTGNKDKKANSKKSKHDDKSTWSLLRSFITTIMHVTIYLTSGVLIMILMWNGLQIIRHSIDNPQARAKSEKALENFAKAVGMLIGSVFIMALCIMSTNAFSNSLETKDYELPIRVNVENADYSFSTTVAGYARYMASTDDANEWVKKLEFGMAYIGLAFINFIAVYAMVIRMFVLGFLSILGPVIAVQYAFKRKPITSFGSWAGMYVVISVLPMVCMQIAYKLILAPIS